MQIDLPEPYQTSLAPFFQSFPIDEAMGELVPTSSNTPISKAVADLLAKADLPDTLASALWLYADELDTSHTISQSIANPTGSYWHGIMHRREGDFSNSHYWFRKVGQHPAIALVGQGYDPHAMIDDVEAATQSGDADAIAKLAALQRQEWVTLFQWCAKQ